MRNRVIFSRAREYLKGNFWRAVLITMLAAVIPGLINGVFGGLLSGAFRGLTDNRTEFGFEQFIGPMIVQGLILLVTWLIASLLIIGEKWSYLEMVDNGRLEIKTIFESFTKRTGRNIWHNLLQSLLIFFWSAAGILGVVAGAFLTIRFITGGGDLSFNASILMAVSIFALMTIILAAWFLMVQYWFVLSEFVLYDKPSFTAYQALRTSRQLIKGYKWQLLRLALRLFLPLILLAAALPFIIGALALVIQEQVWLIGLIALVSFLGLAVYSLVINIRWKAALATFYRALTYKHTNTY